MKKYKLDTGQKINWNGRTLYRIKACIDFTPMYGDMIKAGTLGGYIENKRNLSQYGKSWVCGNALVCDNTLSLIHILKLVYLMHTKAKNIVHCLPTKKTR